MQLTISKNKREKRIVLSKRGATLFAKPDLRPDAVGRIAQGYFDVDLKNSIDGLLLIAQRDFKKHGLDVRELPIQSILLFFNERGNRFKLLMPFRYTQDKKVYNWAVLYHKEPQGRIKLESILELPRVLSGQASHYSIARSGFEYLQEELRMKRLRTVTPLLTP